MLRRCNGGLDQLEQVTLAVPRLKAQAQLNASNSKQLGLLKSVASGLYEELDKLCKKAPAEPLTDLALVQANDLISEVKQLIAGDQFVQKLAEFIPAGDNPQHRDAVIVLRMIRQGLDRYEKQLQALSVQTSRLLNEAKAISGVLHLFSERDYWLDEGELKKRGVVVPSAWQTDSFPHRFDFNKLDRTDLTAYFENDYE